MVDYWNTKMEFYVGTIIFSRNSLLVAGIYGAPCGLFVGCQKLRGRGG